MEEAGFLNLYNQTIKLGSEKAIYAQSMLRLSSWWESIKTGRFVDECIYEEEKKGRTLEWQTLVPSFIHLYNAACGQEENEVAKTLMLFNETLNAFYGLETRIVKDLYQLLQKDPYGLIAALAIFDVNISKCEESASEDERKVLDLIPAFRFVCEGLNVMALRRRWTRIYTQYKDKKALEEFVSQYQKKDGERRKFAEEIIQIFKNKDHFPGGDFQIKVYDRNVASLFYEGMYDSSIHNVIFLQVICPSIPECYRVLCWVESLGPLQTRFVRNNSLWHSAPLGMTRLQTGIKLDGRVVVFRIGTKESIQNNEWGEILKLIHGKRQVPYPIKKLATTVNPIIVYETTGEPFEIEAGSTITDYISQHYSIDEMQFFREAFVNGRSVKFQHRLENHDVLRIEADPYHRNQKLLEHLSDEAEHLSPVADETIQAIKAAQRNASELGRRRLFELLEPFLERWDLKVTDRDIKLVLMVRGHKTLEAQEEFLRDLLTDRSKDNELRWQFLKFLLRGRITSVDGKPLDVHWSNIRIAQCCKPSFKDEIIGTKYFGPRDTNDPRYKLQPREIHVHRINCSQGPEPQNKIELVWKKEAPKYQNYGLQVTFLIPDKKGTLGEILDVFYDQTLLNVHYVSADAVNFGNQTARVMVLATGPTEIDIRGAMTELSMHFPGQVEFTQLTGREARILGAKVDTCPYILSGDAEVNSNLPLLFVDRQQELAYLIHQAIEKRFPCIMLIGFFRIGKTWLLKRFLERYQQNGDYCIYLDFQVPPANPLDPSAIPQEIYMQMLRQLVKFNLSFSHQRPKTFKALSDWIRQTSEENNHCRFILIIDEFSAVTEWTDKKIMGGTFPAQFDRFMKDTPWAYFVLVFQAAHVYGLDDPEKEDNAGAFVDYFRSHVEEKIELRPFKSYEVHELLTDPAKERYTLSEKVTQMAFSLTGGNPFLASKIGKNIWEYMETSNARHMNEDTFRNLIAERYIDDDDWGAFLRRIMLSLPFIYKALMVFLAQHQFPDGITPWMNPEGQWVSEEILIKNLQEHYGLSESAGKEMLDRLRIVHLVYREKFVHDEQCRIESGLLAYYLSINGEQFLQRRQSNG